MIGLCFTDNGLKLLKKIRSFLGDELVIFEDQAVDRKTWLRDGFQNSRAVIFIGATGIAVRMIAPLLLAKDKDPAVIVIDELGRFVIPLVSGHLGGANQLAARLADLIGGTLVLTTATDINNKFAVDSWARANGCRVTNPENIKHISMAILKDEAVGLYSDFPMPWPIIEALNPAESGPLGVCISLDEHKKPFTRTLNLVPQIIQVGLGCRRGAQFEKLTEFLNVALAKMNISLKAISGFSSIDLKKDEPCLAQLAETFGLGVTFYSAHELEQVNGNFTPSSFVKQTTGVDNVCERCAKLASQGEIILPKTTGHGFSLALAQEIWPPVIAPSAI